MANEVNDANDKVERFDQGDRTSENTADDAVIGGDRPDHQQHHQDMKDSGRTFQGMGKLFEQETGHPIDPVDDGSGATNDESVTIVALNPDGTEVKASGKTRLNENDLVKPHSQAFFEAKAQGAMTAAQSLEQPKYEPDQLIATNVTPKVPSIDAPTEFEEFRSDASGTASDTIAWDGGEIADSLRSPIVLLPDYLIGDLLERFGDVQKAIDSLPEEPIRGREMEVFNRTTKDDPESWSKAQALFPELKNVPGNVLTAYTLNELHFYNKMDLAQDILAGGSNDALTKRSLDEVTLGMSQITPKGLRDMCSYFPQLKSFMIEKGYVGNEQKALLDPSCIPMIVAAKTALIVRDLNKHHIPVNTDTVAYSYNADVYSYSDGHGGREYKCLQGALEVYQSKLQHWDQRKEYYANNPRVAQESKHLGNVKKWLNKLK